MTLIEAATSDDVAALALLKLRDELSDHSSSHTADEFATDLAQWWTAHRHSHFAFVARTDDGDIVGAAWIALLPRVPRPGVIHRFSADVQSVFVLPEHRGHGIGAALVTAAYEHAIAAGAAKIVVSSSEGAVSLYRRLGFRVVPGAVGP